MTEELTAVFARASRMLLTEETVASALDLITDAAVLAVGDASGAGVSLLDTDGTRRSTASTNALVARIDELQYKLGEGPCLTAWASGKRVVVDDVRTDRRWPEWAPASGRLGLRSCVSVPLLSGDLAFGAIKIYWESTRYVSPRMMNLLSTFAAQASIFLAYAQTWERAAALSEALKAALSQRDTIAMAKGALMARGRLDAVGAVLALIDQSHREGKTLYEVARDVLQTLPPVRVVRG